MKFGMAEKMNETKMSCCILIKGKNPSGKNVFAYIGIRVDDINNLMAEVNTRGRFNPRDYGAVVLARSIGEPSEALQRFMQQKFNFRNDSIVLELS